MLPFYGIILCLSCCWENDLDVDAYLPTNCIVMLAFIFTEI